MTRDLDRLAGHAFDVLVVGGGIYGLTIAYDAAQRGLSVALIERDDFGSGTSFNHLRTIHGGLRYLQSLDLRRARESVLERRITATIAPHAVRPIRFVLPLQRSVARGTLAMRAGFALDRLVAFDRNRGVTPLHRLPAGRVLSRAEAIVQFPSLAHRGLTGAAVWYDYVTTESDRLTFAFAQAASQSGAVLANHVDATALLSTGRRVTGVRALDALSGRPLDVEARITINATGATVDRLLDPLGASTRMPMLKAMNLVTRREAGDAALGGRSASGRNLFLVPWRGRALFGTWESPTPCSPDDHTVVTADVETFIADLNEAFPSLDLRRDDVTLVHRGVVPAVVAEGRVALEGHEQIRDHAREGLEGILSVVGAKYTTARGVAERVTDQLLTILGRGPVSCRTATTALNEGHIRDGGLTAEAARRDSHGDHTLSHLVAAYGSRYVDILALCEEQPDLRARIADDSPVIGAQIVWAVRHEMAMTLADAVIRRTPLGALGHPGDAAVERAASIVAAELGWSSEQRGEHVAAVNAFYRWDGPATAP